MTTTTKKPPQKSIPSPVWKGPLDDGITFSLLSRYLCCKERFRLYVIEGLQPHPTFNAPIEFGNMWHICEESLASDNPDSWKDRLLQYANTLRPKFVTDGDTINHWVKTALVMFPEYIEFWKKHSDVKNRQPLMQEVSFAVPYELPSGREVKLRGKWDSVDVIRIGKNKSIYLQENKTKGRVDDEKIERQLYFDLQTMLYLIALGQWHDREAIVGEASYSAYPIAGVRYNVIRRPFTQGNRGYIKKAEATKGSKCNLKSCQGRPSPGCQKCGGTGYHGGKPSESDEQFYQRLVNDYFKAEPEYWFKRWQVDIEESDVERFKRECFHPVLDNLLDDYEWWTHCYRTGCDIFDYAHRSSEFPGHQNRHFILPFGLFNPTLDGGESELDDYIRTGDKTGLEVTTNLFPELSV